MKTLGYKILVLILAIGWIFSGWPLVRQTTAEDSVAQDQIPDASSTTPAAEIDSSTPTSTNEITIQQQTETENAAERPFAWQPDPAPDYSAVQESQTQVNEEDVPEEITQPQWSSLPPEPPIRSRTLNKNFRIVQESAYRCDAESFKIDLSGKASAQDKITLGGKKIQSGEIEIGSLPTGVDIQFSNNEDYLYKLSASDNILDLKIVNQEGSQKGSFSVPIFYTDNENNQTTVCQINIVNF